MPVAAERSARSAEERSSRMDLRLTKPQRATYERAAALRGQTLTQWSLAHLDDAARRDIDEATSTVLAQQDFDAFCSALEQPMPEAAQQLLARAAVWK